VLTLEWTIGPMREWAIVRAQDFPTHRCACAEAGVAMIAALSRAKMLHRLVTDLDIGLRLLIGLFSAEVRTTIGAVPKGDKVS
jgi:hypothetical protein